MDQRGCSAAWPWCHMKFEAVFSSREIISLLISSKPETGVGALSMVRLYFLLRMFHKAGVNTATLVGTESLPLGCTGVKIHTEKHTGVFAVSCPH